MSRQKDDNTSETSDPIAQRPIDELPPPGDDDPPPPPGDNGVRITAISPIAGAVVGGITATLTGTGFQAGAEVYFGSSASPLVNVESSTTVRAVVPSVTEPGSVSVSLINPDGTTATRAGGFTYVTTEPSERVEVLGVTPLAVIEDTETEVTLRGRNLIAAYNDGLVALRGPTRAHITYGNFNSNRDEATGIESLIITVRITATPPLEPLERMAIQVLASRRPGAAEDGVFESSRQMFTVLPRAIPVPLGYTANLNPAKPNLVVVAGRNLEGCSLELGDGATVHMQSSDERALIGVVTVAERATNSSPDDPANAASTQLFIRASDGEEVAQYELSVAPGVAAAERDTSSAAAMSVALVESEPSRAVVEPLAGDLSLTLTPVQGQQIVAPTEHDSAVFNLRSNSLSSLFFDWTNFEIELVDISIVLPILNEVILIPFFDGGGDALNDSPVLAQVGKLLRLRGVGLLLALKVQITIHIRVVLIIGFRFDVWDFGFYNEFGSEFPWAIGSVVIGIRIEIEILIRISALAALVLPGGALRILFYFNLTIDIDFTISTDGRTLRFDPDFHYRVNYTRIGPLRDTLFPCEGRFQLAEENGQTTFTDNIGAQQSFYFVRGAGECCVPWEFDLRLVRVAPDEQEEAVQEGFRASYCLNAAPNPDLRDVIITSEPEPEGIPPTLNLNIGESAVLKALARPVDETGNPTGGALRDLRDLGFSVEFYLESKLEPVLDPSTLPGGDAVAVQEGSNIIHAAVTSPPRIIDVETGEELTFGFLPGAVLGFDIARFIAEGLSPAIRAGGLPVRVNALAANTIRVALTIAYRNEQNTLVEAKELERFEPFETTPREYVLAVKINVPSSITQRQTLTFTVRDAQMLVSTGGNTPTAPLNIPHVTFADGRSNVSDPTKFFTGNLARRTQQATVTIDPAARPNPNEWIEVPGLTVTPNNVEAGAPTGAPTKLVPPGKGVGNRDVILFVKLDIKSSNADTNVDIRNSELRVMVRNDETFEEYLRVFKQSQAILSGSGTKFSEFAKGFYGALTGRGYDTAVLKEYGDQLWKDAYETLQGGVKDDRPLYFARLQGIGALRAYGRRKGLTDVENLIPKFEYPSRGLDLNGRILFDGAPVNSRKVIVTGFDPFQLSDEPDRSNPSGLIALEFNKGSVGSSQPPVHIRTAIFPVRYKEFDAGLIETSIEQSVGVIRMLVTTSENGGIPSYDIERWAGKNRTASLTDNNNLLATGTLVRSDLRDPGGATAGGDQFLETTLPYEQVITSDPATHTLRGPDKDQTPFVVDQSYRVIQTTATTFKAGEFRPRPDFNNPHDPAGFIKAADRPDSSKGADYGSGGNYLSNEIFYRTALVRNTRRPSLASGHFHVPGTETMPRTTGPKLLEGVKIALGRLVDSLGSLAPRIISFSPTSARPGGWVTIGGENFTGAVDVRIGGVSVPFSVINDTEITADVTEEANTGFIEVETSVGTAVSSTVFRVVRRFRTDILSENLRARRLELGLTQKAAAERMGVKAGTYANWEQGRDEPRVSSFPKIINFLGYDPNPETQTLAERIRKVRQQDGISQHELAERLGIAASTVRAWEADTVSRPTPRVSRIFEDYVKEVQ